MKPKIDNTKFGSITVKGEVYYHDIVIDKLSIVRKRNSDISKRIYGTSHKVSLDEIRDIYDSGINQMIIGNGQSGKLIISEEVQKFLEEKNCKVEIKKTPDAIDKWNTAEGALIGLFHVTC